MSETRTTSTQLGRQQRLAAMAGGLESTTVRMSLKMKLCVYQAMGHNTSGLL
ncbi:uncharacterized protein LAESUDRAFT_724836 [Laetiporus sulphureus 93-53]|uniref:Uncharacterized protein n=1 Tax=Laetiporus sulphureus 93-53 TaxID=1314785 RepID=A0A165EMN4_9APHY|nr:uncharacterized protein LAESUDRAFT_724836 [Laetiporus sulphureus 93-53]KZT07380.1 hypothetical protein LAESUDRAFT_724836 [Laetiporus sulphureus 93-53]